MTKGTVLAMLLLASMAGDVPSVESGQAGVEARPDLRIPVEVAERMLELAGVTSDDVVYDLGCGDGRIAIAAARRGARAVGVDVDPDRIAAAQANADRENVSHLVRFIRQDTVDLSEATVVTMFVPQSGRWFAAQTMPLRPLLTGQLRRGARIVSNFLPGSMSDWDADRIERFRDAQGDVRARLYVWTHD